MLRPPWARGPVRSADRVGPPISPRARSSVARKYGVKGGWWGLYRANSEMVGRRPDRLNPGTLLLIPKHSTRVLLPERAPAVFGPPLPAVPVRPPLR